MQLTRSTLKNIKATTALEVPGPEIFQLPEKVLQFGTGVLLRGLPAYFIDKANRHGIFNGRIVVIKSTSGDTAAFDQQDNIYTLCVRGLEKDTKVEENIINSSISRVLSASDQWQEILSVAENPELVLIVSNTTEVGIVASTDDVNSLHAPNSFPGKLLAFLFRRFEFFKGDFSKGLIIIPTELILNNGETLRQILIDLANHNKLNKNFIDWLENHNQFCNSLVDRIVPGRLPKSQEEQLQKELGYKDDLMIMSEAFRLWAIETFDKKVIDALSFSKIDSGVVIAASIEKFRELKLRLLNGTHTFSCGLAFLAGFDVVRISLANPIMLSYAKRLMTLEIARAMKEGVVSYNEAADYGLSVLDRFMNPFIDHPWLSITLNYSSKMKMRNIPLLLNHYKKNDTPPDYMCLGFAAYLCFMNCTQQADGKYYGIRDDKPYLVQDPEAAVFATRWTNGAESLVNETLADQRLWGTDLHSLKGFQKTVLDYVNEIEKESMLLVLEKTIERTGLAGWTS